MSERSQKSPCGTFETCRPTLRMSVSGGKTGSERSTVRTTRLTRCGSDLSFVGPLRVFSGRSRRSVLPDCRNAAWQLGVEVLTSHAVASCGHYASLTPDIIRIFRVHPRNAG